MAEIARLACVNQPSTTQYPHKTCTAQKFMIKRKIGNAWGPHLSTYTIEIHGKKVLRTNSAQSSVIDTEESRHSQRKDQFVSLAPCFTTPLVDHQREYISLTIDLRGRETRCKRNKSVLSLTVHYRNRKQTLRNSKQPQSKQNERVFQTYHVPRSPTFCEFYANLIAK